MGSKQLIDPTWKSVLQTGVHEQIVRDYLSNCVIVCHFHDEINEHVLD